MIDLDVAIREIEKRGARWRAARLTVGPVTWRDQSDGWPPRLKTNRADVKDADSIGVALRKGIQEGEVVLFRGGWCDFVYWSGQASENPIQDAPGYPDKMTVEGFGATLDRLTELFQ